MAMLGVCGSMADPVSVQSFFIAAGTKQLPANLGPFPAPNFQVRLSAVAGSTNRLLFSSNLTDWVYADTLLKGSNGPVYTNVWQWPADRLFIRAAEESDSDQLVAPPPPRLEMFQMASPTGPPTNGWHPRRMAIFGSSVALGFGAPNQNGWASRLATALGTNWAVVNKSQAATTRQVCWGGLTGPTPRRNGMW